jgi:hypothetical protein
MKISDDRGKISDPAGKRDISEILNSTGRYFFPDVRDTKLGIDVQRKFTEANHMFVGCILRAPSDRLSDVRCTGRENRMCQMLVMSCTSYGEDRRT